MMLALFGALAFAREIDFCGPAPEASADQRFRDYFATRQLVVVHGYWGGEFDDNREAVAAIDGCIPVTTLNPSWKKSIEDNAEALIPRLKKIAAENFGNEIVLLGHSKGGAEVLQLAVSHPELFARGNVHGFTLAAVLPVQAAIGGSPLADLELKRDPGLLARWESFKATNDVGDSIIARMLKDLLLGRDSAGFHAMASKESGERNARLLKKFLDYPLATRKLLNSKIRYVTSMRDSKNTDDLPFYLRALGKFLAEGGEANDGLVNTASQSLPGIGSTLLNVRHAGHFSLVAHMESAGCRKNFTRTLLEALVGEPSLPKYPN